MNTLFNRSCSNAWCPSGIYEFKDPVSFTWIIQSGWLIFCKAFFNISYPMPIAELVLCTGNFFLKGIDLSDVLVSKCELDVWTSSTDITDDILQHFFLRMFSCSSIWGGESKGNRDSMPVCLSYNRGAQGWPLFANYFFTYLSLISILAVILE